MGPIMTDSYQLERFVHAQDPVYDRVLSELGAGEKRGHWMWFIFPQIAGLGTSPMAQRYAIRSLDEANAYLAHPVLGPRLRECTELVNRVQGRAIEEIFPYPDDLKFRSSMTLFAAAAEDEAPFARALRLYFGGEKDRATLDRLQR